MSKHSPKVIVLTAQASVHNMPVALAQSSVYCLLAVLSSCTLFEQCAVIGVSSGRVTLCTENMYTFWICFPIALLVGSVL